MHKTKHQCTCQECGKDFVGFIKDWVPQKFCSEKCRWKKSRLKKKCKICGKEFSIIRACSDQQTCGRKCGSKITKRKLKEKSKKLYHDLIDIKKINNLIDNTDLRVKEIAKIIGLSPALFSKAFKEVVREYISVYIAKRRKNYGMYKNGDPIG